MKAARSAATRTSFVKAGTTPKAQGYVFIDFRLRLNAQQAGAVGGLFENRFSVYVIEFVGEVREFKDGEKAMAWVARK